MSEHMMVNKVVVLLDVDNILLNDDLQALLAAGKAGEYGFRRQIEN
jgi:hypothetical protein